MHRQLAKTLIVYVYGHNAGDDDAIAARARATHVNAKCARVDAEDHYLSLRAFFERFYIKKDAERVKYTRNILARPIDSRYSSAKART